MKLFPIVAAALMVAVAPCARGATAATPQEKFEKFCAEWMHKLAVREHDNIKNIHWVTDGTGVEGEYVGYSSDHTCKLADDVGKAVVGKIIYREYRYVKKGDSPAAAKIAIPRALEATEVTEIFRYAKGKWEY